jgi:hypothetical protein
MPNVKKLNSEKALTAFMLALLAVNVAFLLWYVFVGYQAHLHSDAANRVLFAREIYDTRSFFPKGWNYQNSDLPGFGPFVFVIPLLGLMPAGFTAHAISGAIFAGLILYGVWLVSGLANLPVWRRLAVVAVIASGNSYIVAENLYGQISYGLVVVFYCYIVFFASEYLSTEGKGKIKFAIPLVIIMLLVFWSNPNRAIVFYGLPFVTALGWLGYFFDTLDKRKYLNLFGLALLGAVGGIVLHRASLLELNVVTGAADARWLSFELILENIIPAIKGLYALLGGLPLAGASLFSKEGLYSSMRFIVASLTFILIPIAIKRTIISGNNKMKLVALFAACSLSLLLFFQLTTSIPDMSDPIQSSRYLVPGMVLSLVVVLMSPPERTRAPLWALSVALVSITFLLSAYDTYCRSDTNRSMQALAQPGQINPARRDLLPLLNEKNLRYGFASYWDSGVLSVLSNEKIRIRPIQLVNGLPMPMRWISSNNWYRPSAWQGETFLLLQDNDVELMDWKKMQQLGLVPKDYFRSNGFTIYVFSENISRSLHGWDSRYEEPARFLPSEGLLSQVGRLEKNAERTVLVAEKGESGALHYGPYINVEPGRYRVTFDIRAAHHPGGSVRLDVVAGSDQKLYGEKTLTESNGPQVIEISLDSMRTMEFRVWALGNERVELRSVSIERK